MLADPRRSRPQRIWYATGIAAFGAALAGGLDLWRGAFGYDFAAYLLAARRLAEGASPYPSDVVLGPFGQFFYPPLLAAALLPALGAPRLAAALWMIALLAVAVVVGWALVRQHAPVQRPWAAAAYVFFPPLIWDLTLGNVTLAAAALAMLAWHLRERTVASAALIAVSIVLKPLALPALLVWVATRRDRTILWSAGFLLLAVLGSWPWLGPAWIDYARVLGEVAAAAPGTGSNILPTALAPAPARWLLPMLAICATTAVSLGARRARIRQTHAFNVALATGPLLATTLWYPYLLLALPLLLEPLDPARPLSGWLRAGRVFAWLLILAQFFGEPGRDFSMPLLGLLVIILLGLVAPDEAPEREDPTLRTDVPAGPSPGVQRTRVE